MSSTSSLKPALKLSSIFPTYDSAFLPDIDLLKIDARVNDSFDDTNNFDDIFGEDIGSIND